MSFEVFLARWSASGDGERANKDSFLNELCDVLGVPRPEPKTGDASRDVYVFEKGVPRAKASGVAASFVDLYKEGCFLLEAKQGAASGPRRRDSPAWNLMMSEAHGQALGYAANLAAPPPFLLVCDIGYCFDVYASFDGTGHYRAFPDGQRKRLFLRHLADHADLLRAIWTDPLSLDPSQRSAAVTREIALQIANLARALEAAGNDPERVATFLMRCLFTMFAEDVGLLSGAPFTHGLESWWLSNPPSFPAGVGMLWKAMDTGGDFFTGRLLRFNGGLFASHDAPPLTQEQLILLSLAARSDWSQVDPSIFGTLLERALNPKERHRLGAHYTPRAYVERLVKPTIEEPLRADWDLVRAAVARLVDEGKVEAAQKSVLEFHHTLCATRVLDPACGTGNFLYVTLDLFKRLESEVLALLAELGYKQIGLEMERYRVTPEQFLGIEVKRWAKEIAELVLWIGYLQWQVRQPGGALTVPQPVLQDFGNIQCRDAVLEWDREELLLDEQGKPVSRWDGETMKVSPVTGEEVPDETARVPVYRYVNPRPAEWPAADFIVGNPPYVGNRLMRAVLGDGYAEAVRKAYPTVPETSDYVLYWWEKAAQQVRGQKTNRFGLITTNSISQVFGRRVVEAHLNAEPPLSIVFAVPDHPWVDTADGAAVRVAMTCGQVGRLPGLLAVIRREILGSDVPEIFLSEVRGFIHGDLRVGVETATAKRLQANDDIVYQGVKLHGVGFILTEPQAKTFAKTPGASPYLRQYVNGRDIAAVSRGVYAIDLFGIEDEKQVRQETPALYQWLLERVKPEREQNQRKLYRDRWWLFAETRPGMRVALSGLPRYIATVETAKHRVFVFLASNLLPDQKLRVIAHSDSWILGCLSCRIHVLWATSTGSWMGVGNDPVYSNTATFLPFPFPAATEPQKQRIRDLGEALDAHRKRQQALHPKLTITGMYNVLEKLRSGEALDAKEREIHEQGLVSILKSIHDDLDAAVFDAYGWPTTLSDEEILERLVALNRERAEEEKRGLVRWLRPEFQNPEGARPETQATLAEAGLETTPAPATPVSTRKAPKTAWPKDLPARVVAVRDLLAEAGETTAAAVRDRYKGVKPDEAEKLLESLAAVGVAIETTGGQGPERAWRLVR